MSTGLECEFFEPEVGVWYYVLQDGSCPVSAWDWREYATAYGPFTSYEEACEHLSRHHANPGGHTITARSTSGPSPIYAQLIEECQARAKREAEARRTRYRW